MATNLKSLLLFLMDENWSLHSIIPAFYTDALIVPNMIDIWDKAFQSEKKPKHPIKIFYSWASEQKGGWSDKGSTPTIAILQQIQSKYGG